jgi:hypothetical protein
VSLDLGKLKPLSVVLCHERIASILLFGDDVFTHTDAVTLIVARPLLLLICTPV